MVKCVSILGSTGSIGRQSLDIISRMDISVCALTAGTNVERMAQQCREFKPKLAVMSSEAAARDLEAKISDLNVKVLWGEGRRTWLGPHRWRCVVGHLCVVSLHLAQRW